MLDWLVIGLLIPLYRVWICSKSSVVFYTIYIDVEHLVPHNKNINGANRHADLGSSTIGSIWVVYPIMFFIAVPNQGQGLVDGELNFCLWICYIGHRGNGRSCSIRQLLVGFRMHRTVNKRRFWFYACYITRKSHDRTKRDCLSI